MLQVIGDEIWFDSYRVGFVDRAGMMGPACPASLAAKFEDALRRAGDDQREAHRRIYRAGYRAGFDDGVEQMAQYRPDAAEHHSADVDSWVDEALEEAA